MHRFNRLGPVLINILMMLNDVIFDDFSAEYSFNICKQSEKSKNRYAA